MFGDLSGYTPEQIQEIGGRLQIVGTLTNGISAFSEGVFRSRQAGADARAELASAESQAAKIRRATTAAVSDTRVAVVGAGASLTSASALEIERDINQRGESDALTAILTGQAKAANQRRLAKQYQLAAVNSATGSLLRGATAFTRWRGTKPPGGGAGAVDGVPNARGDY